ncbi:hypothetical protein CLAIMM_08252 [Cladophialophora immunda]|nr:hypothetical protein CLAIMM_08252 [Cladophialophora immunda]
MADPKNDTIMFEYGEGSPGKQHHHDLTESLLTTTNSPGDYPIYSAPRPDFLSVFNRVAPFVDGLRESGILDRYDYARLRMTCKTTAQELKPYPYDRTEADTKDPYFAGVQAIPCDDCGIPSDRAAGGPREPMNSITAGLAAGVSIETTQEPELGSHADVTSSTAATSLTNPIPNGSARVAGERCTKRSPPLPATI